MKCKNCGNEFIVLHDEIFNGWAQCRKCESWVKEDDNNKINDIINRMSKLEKILESNAIR